MTVVARPRGEGILPLFFGVEGVSPSNRGHPARDTQGRDALATGWRDGIGPARIATTVMHPQVWEGSGMIAKAGFSHIVSVLDER